MRAIIHIGTPKSGTTTIQTFLAMNRTEMISQSVRYQPFTPRYLPQMELGLVGLLRAGDALMAGNKLHSMRVRTRKQQQTYVEQIERDLRAGVANWPEQTYLASSEQIHAWLNTKKRIEGLHGVLTEIFSDVCYVVYYRPQEEFILSTYSENIRRGETGSLESHLDERLHNMNYANRVDMWRAVVGAEKLSVRLLDTGEMKNGDLLDDFCATVGLDRTLLATPPRQNVSLTQEEIELRLKLARIAPRRFKSGAPNFANEALLRYFRRKLPQPGTKLALTDAQRAYIREHYAVSNERLRAMCFPHRETLFSPK